MHTLSPTISSKPPTPSRLSDIVRRLAIWVRVNLLRSTNPQALVRGWLSNTTTTGSIPLSREQSALCLELWAQLCPNTAPSPSQKAILLDLLSHASRYTSSSVFFKYLLENKKLASFECLLDDPDFSSATPANPYCWVDHLVVSCINAPAPAQMCQKVLRAYLSVMMLRLPSVPIHPKLNRFTWHLLSLDESCQKITSLLSMSPNCAETLLSARKFTSQVEHFVNEWDMPAPEHLPALNSFIRRQELMPNNPTGEQKVSLPQM